MYITNEHVQRSVMLISHDIKRANIQYDYIVAVVRGGAVPATLLSHKLSVPMLTINFSLRDFKGADVSSTTLKLLRSKRVLVVDDIIDSGDTARAVEVMAYPNTVDFCCLIYNTESGVDCKFYGMPIKRSENKVWFDFFWE